MVESSQFISRRYQFQAQVLPPGTYRVDLRAPFKNTGQTTPGGSTLAACSAGTIRRPSASPSTISPGRTIASPIASGTFIQPGWLFAVPRTALPGA